MKLPQYPPRRPTTLAGRSGLMVGEKGSAAARRAVCFIARHAAMFFRKRRVNGVMLTTQKVEQKGR